MKKTLTPLSAWSHPLLNDSEDWKSLLLLPEVLLVTSGHSLEARGVCTHPCTLPSDELVIFSLDTRPAAHIIILLLKVWVILQLLRGLERERKSHREEMTSLKRTQTESCAQWALISLTTCPGNAAPFSSEMNLSAPAVRNWNWIVLKIKLFQP